MLLLLVGCFGKSLLPVKLAHQLAERLTPAVVLLVADGGAATASLPDSAPPNSPPCLTGSHAGPLATAPVIVPPPSLQQPLPLPVAQVAPHFWPSQPPDRPPRHAV